MVFSTIRTLTLIAILTPALLVEIGPASEPVAARPAPPPGDAPILTGRNCGSTVLLAGTPLTPAGSARPLAEPLADGSISPVAPGSLFAQTGVTDARLLLERRWTENAPVDDSATNGQFDPAVAFASDGEAYYAWSQGTDRTGDDGDIYFSTIADTGPAQTRRAVRVDDRGGNIDNQFAPSLAITENGLFAIAWADTRNGDSDIYFASSTDQGKTWSTNRQVNQTTLKHSNPFLLAGEQDTLYLVWQATDDTLASIRFAQSDDGGQTWSTETRVNDNVAAATRQNPVLARLSNGNLLAAWSDNRDGSLQVFTARRIPQGARLVWANDVPVDATGMGDQDRPSLAIGANDLVYLAYEKAVSGVPGVFFTRSTDGGMAWEASLQLNDGSAAAIAPSLAVDLAGEPYCAWCESQSISAPDNVLFARSLNAGRLWTQPVVVNDDAGDGVGAPPQIAVAGDGSVKVAWTDGRNLPAHIFTSGWPGAEYYDEGTYTSPVYDAGREVAWRSLRWEATQPAGTGISVEIRVGSTPDPDTAWSDWTALASSPASLSDLPSGQYAQVRVTLSTTSAGVTPEVSDVILLAERSLFLPIALR